MSISKDVHLCPFIGNKAGTSLVVQWLRLCASAAGGKGLIPGQGTKIPHAIACDLEGKKKTKQIITFFFFAEQSEINSN